MTIQRKFLIAVNAAIVASIASSTVDAKDVSFAGKKVNVLIGATPGGGTDGTTRLLGRFLAKYLPGEPTMKYRNMPAGGGIKATGYLATRAKRDGTYWMGGGAAYIDHQTLRLKQVTYDPRTFNYIGGVSRGGSVFNVRASKLANLTTRSAPKVILGSSEGTGTYEGLLSWGGLALKWNFRVVLGYPGTPSMILAAKRGEIDGMGTGSLRLNKTLQASGFKPVVQVGQIKGGKPVPRSSFPNVPTIASLVVGKLSGIARQSFDFWQSSAQIDKWYALPPKTPERIVAIYRAAFKKVVADKEFRKAAAAQFGADFSSQSAKDVTRLVAESTYPSAEINKFMLDLKIKMGFPAKPLTKSELTALAKKLIKSNVLETVLDKIEREGRILHFKADSESHKVRVSGSRTKVSIGGKSTKRRNLKVGMACSIAYEANGGEAQSVKCK